MSFAQMFAHAQDCARAGHPRVPGQACACGAREAVPTDEAWAKPQSQSDRGGFWMTTYTGRKYWPTDPRAEDVSINDIAHSLSMLCRYTGHCKLFYSVAEHSVHISREAENHPVVIAESLRLESSMRNQYRRFVALQGLLHDGTEAYTNDLARPLKKSLTEYPMIEHRNWIAIADHFKLPYTTHPIIKELDNRICVDEMRQNLAPIGDDFWEQQLGAPLGVRLEYWSPAMAELAFLNRYKELKDACEEQRVHVD